MRDSSTHPLPPGPRGTLFLGSLLEAWRDPIGTMTRAVAEHGDVVCMRFGPLRYVLLNDPDAVHHVLVENAKNYVKSRNYQGLKLVLGQGLLTSEGEHWRRQRRLAQPAFHRDRIAGFAAAMAGDTRDMLDRWAARAPATLDVHEEMMRLTFRIVGRTLFGIDVDGEAHAVGAALGFVIRFANDYVESIIRVPTWVPTPRNLTFRRSMATLDAVVARIVADRRARGDAGADLLAMLLGARDETGAEMTERQLHDEVMTIVLAGHETTANALTWAWWLLARHAEVARRVRDEVDAVVGDRDPVPADLARMPLVARVLDEALRLYPPAWAFERQAIQRDVVSGYTVPAGAIVGVSPFVLHRHPRWWADPERFDPDRFAPERAAQRPRWVYLPFGAGPRTCIGAGFATMESQIVLAMMARRFELDLLPEQEVELEPLITLRPKNGLKLRVRARWSREVATPPPRARCA
jgi:cytochrome P450